MVNIEHIQMPTKLLIQGIPKVMEGKLKEFISNEIAPVKLVGLTYMYGDDVAICSLENQFGKIYHSCYTHNYITSYMFFNNTSLENNNNNN